MKQEREKECVSPENFDSTKTTQILELVNLLIDNYQVVSSGKPKAIVPGHDIPGHDLKLYEAWLAEAHLYFRKASNQKVNLNYASEWVLDNYYIIRQSLQQIKEDFPSAYYKQLPKLTTGPLKDFPRVYAIARVVLFYQNYLVDLIDLQTILIQFQKQVP